MCDLIDAMEESQKTADIVLKDMLGFDWQTTILEKLKAARVTTLNADNDIEWHFNATFTNTIWMRLFVR